MSTVTTGDFECWFEDDWFGPGWVDPPVVVLQPGFGRNGEFWRDWLLGLAADFRVVRRDMRGHGGSTAGDPSHVWSAESLADDVVAFLDALGLDRVHYVGESTSGVAGIVLGALYPERFHTITLVQTPVHMRPLDDAFRGEFPTWSAAIRALSPGGWATQWMPAGTPEAEWTRREWDRCDTDALCRLADASQHVDVTDYVARMQVPTLVLAPAQSELTALEDQWFLRTTIPEAEIEVFEGRGHTVYWDEPQRCIERFRSFVSTRAARSEQVGGSDDALDGSLSGSGSVPGAEAVEGTMPFEVITDGLDFPEGPVVLPDGDLVVVEVRGGRLTRVALDGTKSVVAELGGGPNGAAIGPDGAAYVVNNGGFAWRNLGGFWIPLGEDGTNAPDDFSGGWIDRVDLATGSVQRLYDSCDGERFVGPNDIVFDDHGGFWFTDFGKLRRRTMDRGSLLYAAADGSGVRRVADGLVGPNGVGLSPDGSQVYVAETHSGRLLRWDLAGPGEVAGSETIVATSIDHLDSMAVEEDGTVVVGAIRGLFVLRPDHTSSLIPLPDYLTTNVCFGGADRRSAYVTMSASGRLVRIDWPRPGLQLAFPR